MITALFASWRQHPFFSNLSWSFVGGIGSAVLLLIATVLAGRLLGPTEYGKFAAVSALADVLSVFLLFGMEKSSLRHIAIQTEALERRRLLSLTLLFFAGMTIVFCLIYFSTSSLLTRILGLPITLLSIALVYAFVNSLRQISNNFVRSFDKFKNQAFVRLTEGLSILGLFLIFFYLVDGFGASFRSYTWAVIIGGSFAVVLYLFQVRHHFTRSLQWTKNFGQQLSHAKVYFLAAILGVLFGSLDRIIIGKYLGFYDLGVYAAYSTVALSFTAQLNNIMGNVFFPYFSKNLTNFRSILHRVDRASLWGFFPLVVLVAGVILIMMTIFGEKYGIHTAYVIGFSILAVVRMIFSFNAMLVDVFSKGALKSAMLLGNLSNILFAGIFLALVQLVGLSIPLVLIVMIFYGLASTAICKYSLYRSGAYHAVPTPPKP